jgi:hypothetical protein
MQAIHSNDDIVITIPKKFYDKRVQDLIDYIEFKTIVNKSKASQKDIDALLVDIKKERKELMKPLLDKIKKKIK